MSFWKTTGILNNNADNHRCYEKAYLIEKSQDKLLLKPFPFETITNEAYTETTGIIGEYVARSKTIYTPFYFLGFCKGARVKFIDGQELVVKDVIEVQDNKKALSDGKGLIGLNIVF